MKAAWKRLSGNRFLPRSRKLSISSTRLSAVVPKYTKEFLDKHSWPSPGNCPSALRSSQDCLLNIHRNFQGKDACPSLLKISISSTRLSAGGSLIFIGIQRKDTCPCFYGNYIREKVPALVQDELGLWSARMDGDHEEESPAGRGPGSSMVSAVYLCLG
jgi:hypothetical protein